MLRQPGHIDRDGLGDVDVLAGRHGGRRVLRVEVRRALDRHGVHFLQQLQVAFEAGEAVGLGDPELLAGVVDAVLEVVGHGDDVVAAVLSGRAWRSRSRVRRSRSGRD